MDSQKSPVYTLPEGLRYYVLRENSIVPLVPVDQLPFQLHGVSRQLSHRQLSDEGWKFVAETKEFPTQIPVQSPSFSPSNQNTPPVDSTPKLRYLAPDHNVRKETQSSTIGNCALDRPSFVNPGNQTMPLSTGTVPTTVTEKPMSLADTFATIYQQDAQRIGYRLPYPSGIEPDQSKKEYCTHWIRTGECAFMSVGCKYKHEMPSVEKLREIGFVQGMPRWWKEKNAIAARGPTWMQRRLAEGHRGDDSITEVPPRREILDISTWRGKADERAAIPILKHSHPALRPREAPPPDRPVVQKTIVPPVSPPQKGKMTGPIPDMLIDLDDSPAPPPSPQSSSAPSVASTTMDCAGPSSRSSMSPIPPSSPRSVKTLPAVRSNQLNTIETKTKPSPTVLLPRRRFLVSWASDTDDDIVPQKPVHLSQKRRSTPRKASKRNAPVVPKQNVVSSTRSPGLTQSKHAPNAETKVAPNQAKNTANHSQNANRRVRHGKGKDANVPELHAKIEQLQRDTRAKGQRTKFARVPENASTKTTVVTGTLI